jgi:hypothetical protein
MSWLRRLERQLQPLAIPNLTILLIAGMAVAYVLSNFNPQIGELMEFRPKAVLRGEVWRLITFLFTPGIGGGLNPLSLLLFAMYLMFLHLMGSALEGTWGAFRYNVFIGIAYLANIAASVLASAVIGQDIAPGEELAGTNIFLYESIFLAFAWLFPDFEILLFLILPVKVKWLGLLAVVQLTIQFLAGLATFTQGGWLDCVLILASVVNVFIFLGHDIASHLRYRNKRMLRRFTETNQRPTARHTCIVCGATDLTHPDREFRYCTQCHGTPAYCDQHLAGHQHLTVALPDAPAKDAAGS